MKFKIFSNLKNPVLLMSMLGTSVLLFDLQFYLMKNLPGSVDRMCVEGGNFTAENVVFAVVLSLMTGLMIAGLIALYRVRRGGVAVSSLSGIGLLIGGFTVFCTACTLPFITLFGFSIGLSFFTDFNLAFKIVSLGAMILALWLVNKRLADGCEVCEVACERD